MVQAPPDTQFLYHSGMNALVMPHPTEAGKAIAIQTKMLRAGGWKCDDIELARTLPRADAPIVQPAQPLDVQRMAMPRLTARR